MKLRRERTYYVYMVASESRVLYVGVTGNLYRRAWQHKMCVFLGFSRMYRCNRLVYFEEHHYVLNAIAREKQIKRWSRAKKVGLIERDNPCWDDLAVEWLYAPPSDEVERYMAQMRSR